MKGDYPTTELSVSLDIYKIFTELLNPQSTKSKGESNYEDSIQTVKEYIAEKP